VRQSYNRFSPFSQELSSLEVLNIFAKKNQEKLTLFLILELAKLYAKPTTIGIKTLYFVIL